MAYRYAILDVFADTPLAGNPLAVVRDAAGLDDARMQAIAAEFNLSETVFLLPARNPAHSAAVRIFTPKIELPFAGHPTVGAAVYLGLVRHDGGNGPAEGIVILEETVGAVRCGVSVKPGRGHAIFDLPRLPAPLPARLDKEAVAAALGLVPAEIGFENHVPTAWSAGVPYAFIPVRDLDAASRAWPQPVAWREGLDDGAFPAAYVYTRLTVGVGRQFHGRMFAPTEGIPEDPATGSAVAALAGVIHRFDAHPSGTHTFVVEQGFEMGRPSLMALEVDIETAGVAAARIGGDAVLLAEGTLHL